MKQLANYCQLRGGVHSACASAAQRFKDKGRDPSGPRPIRRPGVRSQRQKKSARRDLPADAIFLLVKRPLVGLGNVPAILAGHVALFLTDLMILMMQLRCL
jgi:hypothetical protein